MNAQPATSSNDSRFQADSQVGALVASKPPRPKPKAIFKANAKAILPGSHPTVRKSTRSQRVAESSSRPGRAGPSHRRSSSQDLVVRPLKKKAKRTASCSVEY
ncbi:MAG TPA: hypothetical protein VGO47_03000 [Chlamydiales bacterium]|nr:hypothetical protein [Chlamydiales bacterium]